MRVVAAVRERVRKRAARRRAGDAPVHHEDLAELADRDVVRLEIAVKDALAVRVRDRLADADEDVEHAAQRLGRGAGLARGVERADQRAQRAAADLLHREPELAGQEHAAVVDGDDPGAEGTP